ncbi:MAG: T9SS type A sorting domain-containing protein [Prolixibacteraceae bacterium]|nr:T9SS type A sorting domain-containing protein [Prolixibacteraceae bacterium]
MKKILPLLLIFFPLGANAQNYLISFAGKGESATVSSVKIENLATEATLILNGTDQLRLNLSTGINPVNIAASNRMNIYPNPMTGSSFIQIHPPAEGMATISVVDFSGKMTGQTGIYMDNSVNLFHLSGIKAGFYLINIHGNSWQLTGKLLCINGTTENLIIEKISNNHLQEEEVKEYNTKNIGATHDMVYSEGQILKFTGISGNYTTIITDTPSSDTTITFNFVDCTDGDGNEYPIIITPKGDGKSVEQIWMGANLRSKKYNDGTSIPLVSENNEWSNLRAPGYCWYNNDELKFKNNYGALYNWYTVNTGKLCPSGWHVPTSDEWNIFIAFLGGEKSAGGKLKESGNTHWYEPNTGATNEIGFTALPGGYRFSDGVFKGSTGNANWWTATSYDESTAWYHFVYHHSGNIYNNHKSKTKGFSVRCLKD